MGHDQEIHNCLGAVPFDPRLISVKGNMPGMIANNGISKLIICKVQQFVALQYEW